jgi:hypothetical protein
MNEHETRRDSRISRQFWIGGTVIALLVIGALAYEFTFSGTETTTVGETEAITEADPEEEFIIVDPGEPATEGAMGSFEGREGPSAVNVPPGAITTVGPIVRAQDEAQMAGRPVALTDLLVTRVVGYQSFLAAPANQADQQVLIVLQGPPRADGVQQKPGIDVKAGQRVSVYGTVEQLGTKKAQELGFEETPDDVLHGRDIYVAANRLDF